MVYIRIKMEKEIHFGSIFLEIIVKRTKRMKKILFWLKRKERIRTRSCGQCCLICEFYEECVSDES